MLKVYKTNLLDYIKKISSKGDEPEWMLETRIKSLEFFENSVMPSMRYGSNIHLKLDLDFEKFEFENKLLDDENSDGNNRNSKDNDKNKKDNIEIKTYGKAIVKSLNENLQETTVEFPEIRESFMKTALPDNKILAMHSAFWNSGNFIKIPKRSKATIIINTKVKSNSSINHIILIAEPLSEVNIIEMVNSCEGSSEFMEREAIRSGVLEIHAKEGAQVKYYSLQNLERNTYSFGIKKAIIERDAKVDFLSCCLGGKFSMLDTVEILREQGASSDDSCLFFGNKDQQFEISSSTIHAAPNTKSNMLVKGALDDRARTVYQGLININNNASNSDGYQKQDTLMLSQEAEMNPIPTLEIDNNEVKCSHGASVGQLDKEKLFYLMSRGITEKDAKNVLVQAFFEEIIGKIDQVDIQEFTNAFADEVREIISSKLR